MNAYIRPCTRDDYPALVAVRSAVLPEYPVTVDEIQHMDTKRDPKCKFQRWVAERDNQIVGYAMHDQMPWMYHPRKFFLFGLVHPEYQKQGIGKALYEHILHELSPLEPLSIRTEVREDQSRAVRFLLDRGFKEDMRVWESRLDVNAFDFTPYEGVVERVLADGIEIKTFRELESDPDRNRKLHDLFITIDRDVPAPEPITEINFDHFVSSYLDNPNLLPDAFFLAVHNGEYVGTSGLWKRQADNNMWTGLTGVRREYRRKNIALALKLRGIEYARAHSHPLIVTDNESNNRPMLSINERLGFVRQPAWINLVNVLVEE